jgi:class 3 adenylate cyclase
MSCGGLKVCEKNVDRRLLEKPHAVRILDLAFDMMDFIKTKVLKYGDQMKVKIGIHSGKVISGVVGEHKPQFSLIGYRNNN